MLTKHIYSILFLILVIIISQTFSFILSIPSVLYIPTIIEGATECLPNCSDVSYNYNDATIPNCKQLKIELLKKTDAAALGKPIVDKFTNSINSYINRKYSYDIHYANENIKKSIDKYFSDFSNIEHVTNQDILDNIIWLSDNDFNKKLNSNISDDYEHIKTLNDENKQTIINMRSDYARDIRNSDQELKPIYSDFLRDASGVYEKINSRCDDYYSEKNFIDLINAEVIKPSYSGSTSSFHKVSNYIIKSIKGTLTS